MGSIAKAYRQVFPKVFCIEDIKCTPNAAGGYHYRAVLYHDYAGITVIFDASQRDPRLHMGCFVTIEWSATSQDGSEPVKISGLNVCNSALIEFNPFLNVPRTWPMDRHLIHCARDLWDIAPKSVRRMLMTMLDANAERR